MPEFQRKPSKFKHSGMMWNAPVDAIPEGHICYGRNVRVIQDGTITQRPGLTSFANFTGGVSFLHSIAVLNNFNTDLVTFTKAYIAGGASGSVNHLYVGDTSAHLTNGAINPVRLPPGGSNATVSGKPMTFVDMAPVGTTVGWKYVGDVSMNIAVGYYPGDSTTPGSGPNFGMARAITMGMTPPRYTGIPAAGGVGDLVGDYQWMFSYRNLFTGARSNPSAPSRFTQAHPALTLASQAATFTTPLVPTDPISGGSDPNIVVDIWRFGGTVQDWRFVGTAPASTAFTDNLPDKDVLTSPAPPQITDPITGVTRFNLFRPFVIQANADYGTAQANVDGNGKWTLLLSTGPNFNINWLPGSAISVNNHVFSIYQVIASNLIEIAEDATDTLTSTNVYSWATQTGTLTAGAAMPHIWGPYGTGFGGAYIFGCGGLTADSGTLYWTNGNDPDSTDVANSLIVTSPSEPLRGGCIYDGTPFVFSTERMFRIYPGTVAGQFTVQEVPGGKGLWAEYSLTVQSNAIADQSISWVGKDGIYDWTASGGLQSLTDRDLAPFFPHDNQPGVPLATLFSFLAEPNPVTAPSFAASDMPFHRLSWFQQELFYDYPGVGGSYHTLVFDAKECHGWVSLDQYSNGSAAATAVPVCRGIEIAGNNLKVGVGSILLDYTGVTDGGTAVPCRVVTRQDDLGEARVQKLWGDYMFDAAAGSSAGISVAPLADYGNTSGLAQTFTDATRRQNVYSAVAGGLGVLSISFGFSLTWTASTTPVTLYQYDLAYVPKPELTALRATDKTDDGYNGAKYLRGLCIESNTFNNTRTLEVLVDGVAVATLSITANGQQEIPFAITPIAGSEFQIRPTDTANLWELFAVRWAWEKWPDLTVIQSNWLNLGTSKPKYIRSFSVPISGPAAPALSFIAVYDGTNTYTTTAVDPSSLTAKSPAQFSFNPPILAHQIKLAPSTPCRVWYEEIVWDAEEWPELATMYGPVEKLGDSGAKYLRGLELPIETGGQPVVMSLRYDVQPTSTTGVTAIQVFPSLSTDVLSKNVFPLTPTAPLIAHEFQLFSGSPARFWYGEVKWDYEPWPEFDTGRSPWMDCGTRAAKFMQGLVIPLDTGGLPVTFDLTYDIPNGTATQTVGPFTTQTATKSPVPFSFPVPFIAHELQITPRTNCRVWYEEIKWVFEPVPEMVTVYTTQATDHDLPGWTYFFDAYIAYIGSADAPLFKVITEYGTDTYTLPVSNGVYTRAYLLLNPRKAKWRSYSITSSGGIRLFQRDCEVRIKNWTDKGNYPSSFQSEKPFGDMSREYGARI